MAAQSPSLEDRIRNLEEFCFMSVLFAFFYFLSTAHIFQNVYAVLLLLALTLISLSRAMVTFFGIGGMIGTKWGEEVAKAYVKHATELYWIVLIILIIIVKELTDYSWALIAGLLVLTIIGNWLTKDLFKRRRKK